MNGTISFQEFQSVDIRVGKIIKVEDFPEARKPAYKLTIDFGKDIGIKKSAAQVTTHYKKEDLVGMLVIAVVNFAPKQIGPFVSEVLTLGVPDDRGEVILLSPTKSVPLGGKMFEKRKNFDPKKILLYGRISTLIEGGHGYGGID